MDQSYGNPTNRPSARMAASGMPIQRGNYGGLPPRQPAPQPTPVQAAPAAAPQPVAAPVSPKPISAPNPFVAAAPKARPSPPRPTNSAQFMDFAPSRPTPAAAPSQAPVDDDFIDEPTATPVRPLFTPTASVAPTAVKAERKRPFKAIIRGSLLTISVLLLVGGGIRWVTAGSTSGDTIAVGAVSANDGRSMTIQFTATDGKLHKFSTKSDRSMIPGTATELAYRSGAPEATVRQVSVIKEKRNLGMFIILGGVALLLIDTIMFTIGKLQARGKHSKSSLTTTVTA